MMRGYPGSGKSILAEGLEHAGQERGLRVDRFGEEALFTRAEFARVAEGFRTEKSAFQETPVGAEIFLDAYRAYLANVEADWLVWDWSAVGMVHDLSWAADTVLLRRYLAAVAALTPPGTLRMLELRVAPDICVRRAAAERGEQWVHRYTGLAADDGVVGKTDEERIAAYVQRTESIDGAFALAEQEGWPAPVALDASRESAQVLRQALAVVA